MAKNTMISDALARAIPINNIVDYAKAQPTHARRQPFVNLISYWAEHDGDEEAAHSAINEIQGGQVVKACNLPKEFMPKFRNEKVAEQLIEIVRKIDLVITTHQENWDWAHVMKVMTDEGIIMRMKPNKFDQIICSMIPGKGRDNIRKNGDYEIMSELAPWSSWTKNSFVNPLEAENRTICMMIAIEFQPVLERKILLDY